MDKVKLPGDPTPPSHTISLECLRTSEKFPRLYFLSKMENLDKDLCNNNNNDTLDSSTEKIETLEESQHGTNTLLASRGRILHSNTTQNIDHREIPSYLQHSGRRVTSHRQNKDRSKEGDEKSLDFLFSRNPMLTHGLISPISGSTGGRLFRHSYKYQESLESVVIPSSQASDTLSDDFRPRSGGKRVCWADRFGSKPDRDGSLEDIFSHASLLKGPSNWVRMWQRNKNQTQKEEPPELMWISEETKRYFSSPKRRGRTRSKSKSRSPRSSRSRSPSKSSSL